jgi:hypothetical protein
MFEGSLSVKTLALVAALDGVAGQAPADLDPAQALVDAGALLVAADRLRAVALARVADIERRQLHELDNSPSTSAWVAEQATSMSRGEVALARQLDRVPQVAARIPAGGLSLDNGVLISQALRRLRPHVDRPDGLIDGQPGEQVIGAVVQDGVRSLVGESRGGLRDEDPLLRRLLIELHDIATRPLAQLARLEAAFLVLARHVERGQLKAALGVLVDAVLPNELAKRSEDSEHNRHLDLRLDQEQACWEVHGQLDLETGELLHTAVIAAMATDADNPADTAAAAQARERGLDPYEEGCRQVRTTGQRRHDGLRLALRRLLDSGALGSRGKHVPHIAVLATEHALHAEPGALPARAASGARVPRWLVQRWVCGSAMTRFLFSLGHRVIESSHTDRTLRPHERRIKELETGGVCEAAGCSRGTATGHRLVPHHATLYAVDPTTSLDDAVLLCEVSHHDLHEGNRNVRLKNGRVLTPHGWLQQEAA